MVCPNISQIFVFIKNKNPIWKNFIKKSGTIELNNKSSFYNFNENQISDTNSQTRYYGIDIPKSNRSNSKSNSRSKSRSNADVAHSFIIHEQDDEYFPVSPVANNDTECCSKKCFKQCSYNVDFYQRYRSNTDEWTPKSEDSPTKKYLKTSFGDSKSTKKCERKSCNEVKFDFESDDNAKQKIPKLTILSRSI